MGATFRPLGGGAIGKAEAFDILATWLNIEERSLGAVRLDVFRLVLEMGRYISAQETKGRGDFQPWPESWDTINGLYEGLAQIEHEATVAVQAANEQALLARRHVEAEAEA